MSCEVPRGRDVVDEARRGDGGVLVLKLEPLGVLGALLPEVGGGDGRGGRGGEARLVSLEGSKKDEDLSRISYEPGSAASSLNEPSCEFDIRRALVSTGGGRALLVSGRVELRADSRAGSTTVGAGGRVSLGGGGAGGKFDSARPRRNKVDARDCDAPGEVV